MPKKKKPPANATARCALHDRLMNDAYIRRRGCAMRRCKHLYWLGMNTEPNERHSIHITVKGEHHDL